MERGRRGRSDRLQSSLQPNLGSFYQEERRVGTGKVQLSDLFMAFIISRSILGMAIFVSNVVSSKAPPKSIAPKHVQAGMDDLSEPLDGLFG
jgi:hypothetical protein